MASSPPFCQDTWEVEIILRKAITSVQESNSFKRGHLKEKNEDKKTRAKKPVSAFFLWEKLRLGHLRSLDWTLG
jgi:hypothetical protein